MRKKVIFVGGTSYSGSTMLDMILSNDTKGYSLGEVYAIFRPRREHHFTEIQKLRSDERWNLILKGGEKNMYSNLFKLYKELDFFVDSSKEPLWFDRQFKILLRNNIEYKNVLIYKTPQELAHSFSKRNKLNELESTIEAYYKTYLYYVKDFKSISYKQLVKDRKALELLCGYLEIPYFPAKENFWEKEHHTFFGNIRARVHTDNLRPENTKENTGLTKEGFHQLYYVEPKEKEIIDLGNRLEEKYKNIFEYIYANNITSSNNEIKYYSSIMEIRRKWVYSQSKILYNNIRAKFKLRAL